MQKEHKIINKIYKLIQTYGIPYYLKKWKKIDIPNKFSSPEEFISFLNKFVKSYHRHSFIWLVSPHKSTIQTELESRPMPNFKWDDKNKIGTIIFYYFFNSSIRSENIKSTNEIVRIIHTNFVNWIKLGVTGIIIDLRKHTGGNMWPHVESLKDILGDTSLISFGNTLTEFTDKKWSNIQNNKIVWRQKFISDKLAFDKPIAIIVGKNTISSGEFIAAIFYGRSNVRIFGDKINKTVGYLSSNEVIKINKDISFALTNTLCTTVDGTFHINEYLPVDKMTDTPITDAKKWILSEK